MKVCEALYVGAMFILGHDVFCDSIFPLSDLVCVWGFLILVYWEMSNALVCLAGIEICVMSPRRQTFGESGILWVNGSDSFIVPEWKLYSVVMLLKIRVVPDWATVYISGLKGFFSCQSCCNCIYSWSPEVSCLFVVEKGDLLMKSVCIDSVVVQARIYCGSVYELM